MLLIRCPWCGPRAHIEFAYGGDATVTRPADPDQVSDEAWHDYIYIRPNPKGAHAELWMHSAGCRSWFKVLRDTRNHKILATGRLDEALAAPEEKT